MEITIYDAIFTGLVGFLLGQCVANLMFLSKMKDAQKKR